MPTTRTGGPSKANRKKIIGSAIERQQRMTNPGNASHEGLGGGNFPNTKKGWAEEGAKAKAHDQGVKRSGRGKIWY